MAIRVPSLFDSRDPLLVLVVLTMLLDLGLVGSALVNVEPLPRAAAEGPHPPGRIALPSPMTSPHAETDRFSRDHASDPGHSLRLRPDPVVATRPSILVVASVDDDPREYLGKMAVLQRRRGAGRDSLADPYQASLNLGVYLTDTTTPIAPDCDSTIVSGDRRCGFR